MLMVRNTELINSTQLKQRRNSLATSKAENACLQGHQLVIIVLQ